MGLVPAAGDVSEWRKKPSVVLSAGSKSENSISLQPRLLFNRHKEHKENKRGNVVCMDVHMCVCVCVCCRVTLEGLMHPVHNSAVVCVSTLWDVTSLFC